MNQNINVSFQISGETLDAIFGRKLNDRELLLINSKSFNGWITGEPSLIQAILNTFEELTTIINDAIDDGTGNPTEDSGFLVMEHGVYESNYKKTRPDFKKDEHGNKVVNDSNVVSFVPK
jgi:hypothetical protein